MNDDDRERPEKRSRLKVTDRRSSASDRETAPGETGAVSREGSGEGDSHEVRSEGAGSNDLAATRAKAQEYLDHLRRLQAEFDNYRKRVLKEQTRAVQMAAEPLVRRLLEVLDDFELALMAAAEKPDFDRFLHGVELVYAKLLDTLRAEGLEKIEAQGKLFDPEQHEALMQTGEGDGEPIVDDVLRQGYRLSGHVIRPAGVRVTREGSDT
jgi:molecular chaperone GrpE